GVDPNLGGRGGAEGFGGFAEAFGDIFGDIFGGNGRGRGGQQVYRGSDLSYAMEITLEEAAQGKETQIRIPSWDTCETCKGSGAPGPNGGPNGDLYIEIRIKQHEIFERDGDDLHCTVPVGMASAALGATIEVPTLGGSKAEIDLPEGTQHGKTFRLRGKGIK